jgi:hypothetical protein
MSERLYAGSAFPFGDPAGCEPTHGMTLRDYFAAHAPANPWASFAPQGLPVEPVDPDKYPRNSSGNGPDKEVATALEVWRDLECDFEAIESRGAQFAQFAGWCAQWRAFWKLRDARYVVVQCERDRQWPWFYADAMLAERAK